MSIAEALKARISIDNAHSLTMRSEILIKQVWALSMLDQVGEDPRTGDHGRSTGLASLAFSSDCVFHWWRQFPLCFHREHLRGFQGAGREGFAMEIWADFRTEFSFGF